MRTTLILSLPLVLLAACTKTATHNPSEEIVAMEKAALDRWGKGDPQGVLDIYAPEITYFDPFQEKRIDGIEAMRKLYAAIAGKIKVGRCDMIDPRVQWHGDVAVLTYNLVDEVLQEPGSPGGVRVRWNSTQVYARAGGTWRVVHSHWSFTKPELRTR
jgi:ketosteroid isomerase-like protein